MPGDLFSAPRIISLSPLSLATNVTDATLGASSLWLGTRTLAGGTDKLAYRFLAAAHGSVDSRYFIIQFSERPRPFSLFRGTLSLLRATVRKEPNRVQAKEKLL